MNRIATIERILAEHAKALGAKVEAAGEDVVHMTKDEYDALLSRIRTLEGRVATFAKNVRSKL